MTIDEKIDIIIKWLKDYPGARISKTSGQYPERVYAETLEEKKEFMDRYDKIKEYYNYLVVRKRENKLTPEQIERCIRGNIGGVFNMSEENIQMTTALAQKSGQPEATIRHIIESYGTWEEFILFYRANKLSEKDRRIAESIFNKKIDVEMGPNTHKYNSLVSDIFPDYSIHYLDILLYRTSKIKEAIDAMPNKRQRDVLMMYYGLADGKTPQTIDTISEQLGIKLEYAKQCLSKTLEYLKGENVARAAMVKKPDFFSYEITREEKEAITHLEDYIYESDLILSNYPSGVNMHEPQNERAIKALSLLNNYENIIKERQSKREIARIERYNKPIDEIGIPEDVCRYFSQMGIKTINDLCKSSPYYSYKLVELIGKDKFIEIMGIDGRYDPNDAREVQVVIDAIIRNSRPLELSEKYKYVDVDEMGLSMSTCEILKSNNINTLKDLVDLIGTGQLCETKFGSKVWKELTLKLKDYDITLNFTDAMVPIEELNLSSGLYRCLKCNRIDNLQQLTSLTLKALMQFKGMGKVKAMQLQEKLETLGICLKDTRDKPDIAELRTQKEGLMEEVSRLKKATIMQEARETPDNKEDISL